jgi:hypothetical protein
MIMHVDFTQGLAPGEAAIVVNLNSSHLTSLFNADDQGGDFWIACAVSKNGKAKNAPLGRLEDIADFLGSMRPNASRAFLVNASNVKRQLLARAAAAKVDLS